MVDDFMVCVDRLILASACFESVNNGGERDRDRDRDRGNRNSNIEAKANESAVICVESCNVVGGSSSSSSSSSSSMKKAKEMVECRICQEEEDFHSMETPCACSGTLKFAHRKCIQRWCNKKGDITCEICNQVFSPNYSIPPARSNTDVLAIDIRQAWGQHIDFHDSHLLALAAAERQLLQAEYEEYAAADNSSIACLRSIALILLVILLLSQALLATRDAMMVQESSLYSVSLLRFAGFLLPCYVMVRSWYTVQSRRRQG